MLALLETEIWRPRSQLAARVIWPGLDHLESNMGYRKGSPPPRLYNIKRVVYTLCTSSVKKCIVRGRRGFCFLFGSGECLRFSVSGVGAGVGPCVFGCWLVSLPSLALFGGLPLDPDYAVPDAEKKILRFHQSVQDTPLSVQKCII